MEDIHAEEFADLLKTKQHIQLLDVRESLEYHTYNIGGLHIPLGKLPQMIEDDDLELDPKLPVIVICQRGLRSKTAKHLLENAGYTQARNLIGGLLKLQHIQTK